MDPIATINCNYNIDQMNRLNTHVKNKIENKIQREILRKV
jgi:hypothetical protein